MPAKKRRVKALEASMIDAYIQDLDCNYLKTDDVFRTTEPPEIGDTVHSVQMRESDGEVAFFQQLTKSIQPFSLRETGNSVWALGEKQWVNKQDYVRNHDVKDPGNTIAVTFVETKVLTAGITVPLLQRFIARRFDGENSIVHTWKFITEAKGVFDGMQMDETGWCRFLPSLDDSQPGTTVEMCIRRVPVYFRACGT
ncbi:Hypothetical protein PHPALM_14169 [Phytophthora palmivora]|uniref:Uncharacterized protein n=1 Tax=Phytophthora palmivora TaxID=4796 RepID=A0A2P4XVG0_9STRA|nr:Hypothetical protein PHPALM_14169 [Phytophthora palmivora]